MKKCCPCVGSNNSGQNGGVAKIIIFWYTRHKTRPKYFGHTCLWLQPCGLPAKIFWPRKVRNILATWILATVAKIRPRPKLWPRKSVNFGHARLILATRGQNFVKFWPRTISWPKWSTILATFSILATAGQNILATPLVDFGHNLIILATRHMNFGHASQRFWARVGIVQKAYQMNPRSPPPLGSPRDIKNVKKIIYMYIYLFIYSFIVHWFS